MVQLEAFPLRIIEYRPFATKTTAHAIGRAQGEDRNYYIIKANTSIEDTICATEWIGNSFADSLNLPVAKAEILQMPDGQLVIGSLEVKPRLADIEVAQFLTGQLTNDLFVAGVPETLSSTFAFDLAIGNADRHERNFVIRVKGEEEAAQRHGELSLIDFSSADLLSSNRSPVPFARQSNTSRAARLMRSAHGFVQVSASDTVNRFAVGRSFMLDRAMVGMPAEWLSDSKRDYLRNWMLGSSFTSRLERIENGLRDGSFL